MPGMLNCPWPVGRRRGVALITLACCSWLLAVPAAARDTLPLAVQANLTRLGVPASALGLVALPLGHRARAYKFGADVPMQPGSAMKLVTAVVALDRLSLVHVGRTRLRTLAVVEDGVLRGDLVLEGGGDPDFGFGPFYEMLSELRDQGITRIDGDLVLDRNRYRPARLDVGAPPFDENPERWWNVIPDALLFEGGLLPVELRADKAATQISVRTKPRIDGLVIDSSALTPREGPCAGWDDSWATPRSTGTAQGVVVTLQGSFPRGCSRSESLQIVDRTQLLGLVFAQIWRQLGGQWTGKVREAEPPPVSALPATAAESRVLVDRRSRPWAETLRPLMKTSDNTLTRLLFLEIGVKAAAVQQAALPGLVTTTSTLDIARADVRRWFDEQRIPAPGLVVDNGSGLSRSERITPMTLALLLQHVWRSPGAADVLMSLPVAGVDGTLRNRLKESPAAGTARLKTGTLRNVAALTGVVLDAQKRPWAVALIVNHDIGSGARPLLDAFVDHIARFGPHGSGRLPAGPLGDAP